ncbi:KpsF/GutQ family sugar-phosphate isomerase [Nocardioides cavernaquae]|uniref:KpsF/GutQ family sugar-phosphate isomerase n=1 Tax=Nocardioides cavernaquae TaxID=2321396 RepID=A0A3A5HBJ3_9ACTN|nr:KpsF/GutQ family sugar-phosphate isomerase [Nocardioides cavernaquae]RJS45400.1 KpsF/GutQ family sugar-phosphate isomerase [Nocardioides cavernaquae]
MTAQSPEGRVALDAARRVFEIEAQAVLALAATVDGDFVAAVSQLIGSQGRAIVCGMGKSGIIGRKIAATFASTGTPSFFMHPGEAYHGDLGMVDPSDTFIAISNSGETDEVIKLLPFLAANGNVLIAMTGSPQSTLARAANLHLNVGVAQEACPLQLAPTASTTATLAMGDALAVALMETRGFQPENFARFHPGGSLGRRLLSRVEDEMVVGDLPIVDGSAGTMDVISAITGSRLGLALVRSESGWGVITDGDVRRAIEKFSEDVFNRTAADLMTLNPAAVSVGTRMEDALAKMERHSISALLVFNGDELAGVLKK